MGLFKLFVILLDPFGVWRKLIVRPVLEVTTSAIDRYVERTKDGVTTARDVFVRATIVAFAAAIIIWSAIFMYLAFYYTYMPAIAHVRSVHMQYE